MEAGGGGQGEGGGRKHHRSERDIRKQQEDRPHRIGQKHPVLYIDLIARNTVDDHIATVLEAKQRLIDRVVDDSTAIREQTIETIDQVIKKIQQN